MNRENQDDRADSPHGHRDRGVSTDQPIKEETRQTKPGSHDPEATGYEADKTLNRIVTGHVPDTVTCLLFLVRRSHTRWMNRS